jgi:hypothetical protein
MLPQLFFTGTTSHARLHADAVLGNAKVRSLCSDAKLAFNAAKTESCSRVRCPARPRRRRPRSLFDSKQGASVVIRSQARASSTTSPRAPAGHRPCQRTSPQRRPLPLFDAAHPRLYLDLARARVSALPPRRCTPAPPRLRQDRRPSSPPSPACAASS